MKNKINAYFGIEELGSTIKREMLAGFTTFISMAYILFVNPAILGDAGMDKGAVFTATGLASAFGCIMMGVFAKYPIATAPALGINAFFAYSVCIGMGVSWQTALAGVFLAGIIFLLLTIFKLREMIIDAIPVDLKYAISAGIGLFIAFIGLRGGGIIVPNKETFVSLGHFQGTTWIAVIGLVATGVLMLLNVPGAIFIAMLISAVFGVATGMIDAPTHFVSSVPSLKPTLFQAFTHVTDINSVQLVVVVLTFLLVTFFDTAGTLIGLAQQAGFMKDNKMPRVGQALLSDSSAMVVGALLGTSPVGAYVESSAGIAVGGRSGFTAVTTGVLFILGLFFSPLLSVVTPQVTASALIIVGVLMAQNMAKIEWGKLEIAIPSFLILIGMPLTYSISDGLALGIIMYPITMIAAKRGKEVSPLMYVLFFVFVGFLWILNAPK
ncbi:NCS2 family permease [Ligilactobacillus ceti]|uniref:NCS2 family permease n=1 Tax=Ligilactobacillus ceti TaxID=395085 RepID=UPI0004158C39|nr:NCS2 family permease [Ligilactobacillus ceti]